MATWVRPEVSAPIADMGYTQGKLLRSFGGGGGIATQKVNIERGSKNCFIWGFPLKLPFRVIVWMLF